jgi:hypothetical protein
MKTIVLFAVMAVAVATPLSTGDAPSNAFSKTNITPLSKTNIKEEDVEQAKTPLEPVTQVKEELPIVQEKDVQVKEVQVKEDVVPISAVNMKNIGDFAILIPIDHLRTVINLEGLERHVPHVPVAVPAVPALPAIPSLGGSSGSHSYGYGSGASGGVRAEGEMTNNEEISEVPSTAFQFPQSPIQAILSPFQTIFRAPSFSKA